MPITRANATKVHQVCAVCGTERDIATSDLVLGSDADPDMIVLPGVCAGCGSTECIARTWDVTPEWARGTHHDLHRRAVNALAKHLLSQGRAHANARTDDPPDLGEWDVVDVPRPKKA